MKPIHIIVLVLIAVAVGIVASSYGDASTYESFKTARQNAGKTYHVVGTLNRSKEKQYNPAVDANFFSFYLIDESGTEMQVIYRHPEPPDFERSEKIVIVGQVEGEHFEANKILLKCPSKYTDNAVKQS